MIGVGKRVRSPARLIRARSGVVPYTARAGLLEGLVSWVDTTDPFAGCVIGGRVGTGKTRLGVELCERAAGKGWLAGLLSRTADPEALEALAEVPYPRLVVIDYAASRAGQVEVALQSLAVRACPEYPVRVLLLFRAGPKPCGDWTEALRGRGDMLDARLDDMDEWLLEDEPLATFERLELFQAAAGAFAKRASPEAIPVPGPPALDASMFANPLMVVIAAYLAVHGNGPGDQLRRPICSTS